ncbi:MAG: YbaB/EbfC family nucleoid-associated protein [Rhodobacter sp.]|nr:YbaB/EbfC family nucleoid-associated protein [Rhodobacter sp.]
MIEKTMTVKLSAQEIAWVNEQIATGDYASEGELFADSIAMHQAYNDLVDRLSKDNDRWHQSEAALECNTVEGRSEDGAITIHMNGQFEVRAVLVDSDELKSADARTCERAIHAALRDVLSKVNELRTQQVNSVPSDLPF